MIELLSDKEALSRTTADEIASLTRRATDATYYSDGLTVTQIDSIERVVRISAECVGAAATNVHQHLVTATLNGVLAGYVIATIHADDDRELDWIMVDPALHGSGVGSALLRAGMVWLGDDKQIWLNVIRKNDRAIFFYAKHGFVIDQDAPTNHVIPHYIMRRGPRSRRP